jgi:6-phosphogluconolactonase
MDVIVSETADALAERVAADLTVLILETLKTKPRCMLALSGGATPKKLYQRLAKPPFAQQIPWSKVWLFFGDERCVGPEHPDSNFRMVKEALLNHVPVLSHQVLRMHGEEAPPQAARDYENEMKRIFGTEQPFPSLDLILLGLGPDGHTASLFPDSPAMIDGDRWVVGNVVRSLQTVRITMALPVLNAAKNVWFLVTGNKKSDIYKRVQEAANPALPASLVDPASGQLRWYIDKALISSEALS